MHWPSSIETIQRLPQTEDLNKLSSNEKVKHEYKPEPHNDEIIDILTNYSNNLPYFIITYRSIYLFDWNHKVPINAHIRSNESITKFGYNKSIKLSPNQQTIAILTNLNILLIYTFKLNGSDSELLTIYDKNSKIVQNGYPLSDYVDDSFGYGGINKKFVNNNNTSTSGNNGIVKNLIDSFIGVDDGEVPIYDLGLRLKLILNISTDVIDYCFTSSMELLLINKDPHSLQIINLNNQNNNDEGKDKDSNYRDLKDFEWFKDVNCNNGGEINKMEYNYDLNCFLWINEFSDVLIAHHTGESLSNFNFNVKCLFKCELNDNIKVVKGLINHLKNLVYLLLGNGDILVFKLYDNFTFKLLKRIKKCLPSKTPLNLQLHPNGDSFLVHFDNGWNIYSLLGNLNFSTFEYDYMKITNCNKINYLSSKNLIIINNSNEILTISLTVINNGEGFNFLSIKRPLLYDNDKIHIFKGYEKKLIEHHHYNYNINDITNKETEIWLNESLPLSFRLHNHTIRSTSVSNDGNYICIIGNYDIIIFNNLTKMWKFLQINQDTTNKFEKIETSARKCLWWNNYLILGFNSYNNGNNGAFNNKQNNDNKSEVVIFSNKILEKHENFSSEFIIWNFNFIDTPYDNENFVNFNIDIFTDTLFVITNKINCYTWNLKLSKQIKDRKLNNEEFVNNNKLINERSLKLMRSSIIIQKSTVYQLSACFKENDESIVLNYGTSLKINETDILFLTNTDLYYIKREKMPKSFTFSYNIYLINDSVEYVHKLNNSLICLFDGSRLLHYNLSDDIDMLKLKSINISIGNDIIKGDNEMETIVKYSGVCPYPITTIPFQNIVFGIEVECFDRVNLKLETIRRNYLSDVVDHYIESNIKVKHLEEDSNAINIKTVYQKFSRFKNFKFVLEKLMVDYLQECYDNKEFDLQNEYFDRLYLLIKLTGSIYDIILNCLKKTETHYWPIFFEKSKERPRYIVNKLFAESNNQRLTAHFFIIMLNYEKYDTLGDNYSIVDIKRPKSKGKNHKNNKNKDKQSKISKDDQDIVVTILKKLIISKDFDTAFELVRFLKIVDKDMTHKCLTKMKSYLENE